MRGHLIQPLPAIPEGRYRRDLALRLDDGTIRSCRVLCDEDGDVVILGLVGVNCVSAGSASDLGATIVEAAHAAHEQKHASE